MKRLSEQHSIIIGLTLILVASAIVFWRMQNTSSHTNPENTTSLPSQTQSYLPVTAANDVRSAANLSPEDYAVIDVRDPNSFAREHIVGSQNIPLQQLSQADLETSSAANIILVDYDGSLAQDQGASEALLAGVPSSKTLTTIAGGFRAWQAAQLPTISEGDITSITDQAKVSFIAAEQLKSLLDTPQINDHVIIDTRPTRLFDSGHIPGAINIPLEALERNIAAIPFGKLVIVYSIDDIDTFQSAVRLYDLNYIGVRALDGGARAWQEAAGPLAQ